MPVDPVEISIGPEGSVALDVHLSDAYRKEYADYMRSIGREDLVSPASRMAIGRAGDQSLPDDPDPSTV